MATKPTAARGKTTRKEKLKRKAKDVLTRMSLVKDPDELAGINNLRDKISNTMESFLNPVAGVGSMVGTRAFQFAKQQKPTGRVNVEDLESAKKAIKKLSPGEKKARFGAKRGGKMSTGGEVDIDMTTEMDV